MSGAVAVAIIDALTGMAITAMRSAASVRKAAATGGEFTPEEREAVDVRLRAARQEVDDIGRENGWLE